MLQGEVGAITESNLLVGVSGFLVLKFSFGGLEP